MRPNILVIGTVFVDCKGFVAQTYHPQARNLGKVRFFHGGVGRNVAENLAMLNLPVTFLSSVDTTPLGREVVERLRRAKVDTEWVVPGGEEGMGFWLALLDAQGELAGSVSQMPDLRALQAKVHGERTEISQRFSDVILELDLTSHLTNMVIQMGKRNGQRMFGIPGNLDVVLSNKEILQQLDCFICNNYEADRLLGTDFSNAERSRQQQLLQGGVEELGLRRAVVTLGSEGCVYFDSTTKEGGTQPASPVAVVESTGAGDAFFSGTVMGLIAGKALDRAVIYGTQVATWTLASEENTCLDLREKIRSHSLFQDITFAENRIGGLHEDLY